MRKGLLLLLGLCSTLCAPAAWADGSATPVPTPITDCSAQTRLCERLGEKVKHLQDKIDHLGVRISEQDKKTQKIKDEYAKRIAAVQAKIDALNNAPSPSPSPAVTASPSGHHDDDGDHHEHHDSSANKLAQLQKKLARLQSALDKAVARSEDKKARLQKQLEEAQKALTDAQGIKAEQCAQPMSPCIAPAPIGD